MLTENIPAIRFLVIGDPHMDGAPSFLPDHVRRTAFRQVFRQGLDYCVEQGIKRMCWAGDVFNSYPPSQDSLAQVVEMDQACFDAGVQLYIIDGNHGYVKEGETSLSLLERLAEMHKMSARIYTGDTVVEEIEGNSVAFMPWPHKDTSMLTKPSLIFAHVDRPGAKLDNGRLLEGVEDFPLGDHSWVIGHIHKPQKLYVGAPLPLKWGDQNERRMWDVTFQDGECKRKNVAIDNPYFLDDLVAHKESDLAGLADREDNAWTRVLLGPELLGRSREIQEEYERVVCHPLPQTKEASKEGDDADTGDEDAAEEQSAGPSRPVFMDEETFARKYLSRQAIEKQMTKEEIGIAKEILAEIA